MSTVWKSVFYYYEQIKKIFQYFSGGFHSQDLEEDLVLSSSKFTAHAFE